MKVDLAGNNNVTGNTTSTKEGSNGGTTNIQISSPLISPMAYLIIIILAASLVLAGVCQISALVYFSHMAQETQKEMVSEMQKNKGN